VEGLARANGKGNCTQHKFASRCCQSGTFRRII
jgi:hypothetical protein